LKAAGVALNLTVASECFLLDLWWNPAAELQVVLLKLIIFKLLPVAAISHLECHCFSFEQAIDRLHRLGQYRPIRAVRFVAEGTVEERVLQLQEKKRLVFDGTVGRDAGSLKMLTAEDMKALFA
jgi:DNA repair protein RAD16